MTTTIVAKAIARLLPVVELKGAKDAAAKLPACAAVMASAYPAVIAAYLKGYRGV